MSELVFKVIIEHKYRQTDFFPLRPVTTPSGNQAVAQLITNRWLRGRCHSTSHTLTNIFRQRHSSLGACLHAENRPWVPTARFRFHRISTFLLRFTIRSFVSRWKDTGSVEDERSWREWNENNEHVRRLTLLDYENTHFGMSVCCWWHNSAIVHAISASNVSFD